MSESQKRTRRKDLRPQEIIDAAVEVFAEFGFAGAKMEEIARRASAAKGTLYRYFDTKEALFEAAVKEKISPMFQQMQNVTSAWTSSFEQLFHALIGKLYAELISNPDRRVLIKILISEGDRFPQLTAFYHEEILSKAKQLLRHIVKQGIESGEFRPTLAQDWPDVLIGPAILAAVWKTTFDHVDPLDLDGFAKAHVDVVLNGLLVNRKDG